MVAKVPEDHKSIQSVSIDPSKKIKAIRAFVASNCAISKLQFLGEKDSMIAEIGSQESNNPVTYRLEEGETIIGLYGVKKPALVIYGLGFIVWEHPCLQ